MKEKKKKPTFKYDCRFFQSERCCTAYKGEETFLISCGKDCPFYERDEKTLGKEPLDDVA